MGAALNVTVLILHEGRRLKPGSIWDLSYGGACVWVPEPLELETGATVELQLITAQDANSIQLEATLCWTKTCDGQWFVGFRFAPPGPGLGAAALMTRGISNPCPDRLHLLSQHRSVS